MVRLGPRWVVLLFLPVVVVVIAVVLVVSLAWLCLCWGFLCEGPVNGVHFSNGHAAESRHGRAHLVFQVGDHLLEVADLFGHCSLMFNRHFVDPRVVTWDLLGAFRGWC